MSDLDTRAHDAATAARRSVDGLFPGDLPPRRSGAPRVMLAGAALAVVALIVIASGDDATRLSTVPSQAPTTLTGPPGPPPPLPDLGIGGLMASEFLRGTASDGRAWAFYFGGPSNGLCFGVDDLDPHTAGGTCNGGPGGTPAPDPYRPLFAQDTRMPFFVAGRMPEGVTHVSVVLADGSVTPRQPVFVVPEGTFYAVEVPQSVRLQAVVGYRPDGSTVRFDR